MPIVMIDAIARSVHVIPIGAGLHAAGLLTMVRSAASCSRSVSSRRTGDRRVLVANTALAILSRAAPQLNILSVPSSPDRHRLVSLSASIPSLAPLPGWSGVYVNTLDKVLSALVRRASDGRPSRVRTHRGSHPRRREEARDEGGFAQSGTDRRHVAARKRHVLSMVAPMAAADCSRSWTRAVDDRQHLARSRIGHDADA